MAINDTEYRKNTRQFILYSLIFVCIVIIGIYYKQKGKSEDKLLDKNAHITIGTVTSIRYSTRGDWVRYMYVIKGNKFEDVKNTYSKGINVGDAYEVEYLPNNPEINRINFDKKLGSKNIND